MNALMVTPGETLTALTYHPGTERLDAEVDCEPKSVGVARRLVSEQLRDWGLREQEIAGRIVLVVSELVTNAVQHARTRTPCEKELIYLSLFFVRDQLLVVRVADNSSKLPVIDEAPADEATSGRGLLLVDTLSDGWAVSPSARPPAAGGKSLWAKFLCPRGLRCPAACD